MDGKILIIGNGFDLYHHLPTRYNDFLFFCNHWKVFLDEYQKKYFISVDNAEDDDYPLVDIRLNTEHELIDDSLLDFAHYDIYEDNHIAYLSDNAPNNAWITYFNKIAFSGANWIDFEGEIQRALEIIDEYYSVFLQNNVGKVPIMNMKDSMKRVITTFGEYVVGNYTDLSQKTFNSRQNDYYKLQQNKNQLLHAIYLELNKLSTCLSYYLYDFVTRIRCNCYSSQIKDLGNINLLLNFNYTYTFSRIYGKGEDFYHHPIHGEARENNIVLGVSDDIFNGTTDYVYFQKYFQRIQKKTGNFYKDYVIPIKHKSLGDLKFDLYVMGHSLDRVDKGILQDFFYSYERINTIKIFYYDQKAYENIVINLIDMFGKDFVIEQTGKDRIIFEELKKETEIKR